MLALAEAESKTGVCYPATTVPFEFLDRGRGIDRHKRAVSFYVRWTGRSFADRGVGKTATDAAYENLVPFRTTISKPRDDWTQSELDCVS